MIDSIAVTGKAIHMPQITVKTTASAKRTFFNRVLTNLSIKQPLPNPPPSRGRE
jgi:hypothetical protein